MSEGMGGAEKASAFRGPLPHFQGGQRRFRWLVSPLKCPCLRSIPVPLRSLVWGLAERQARAPSSWGIVLKNGHAGVWLGRGSPCRKTSLGRRHFCSQFKHVLRWAKVFFATN